MLFHYSTLYLRVKELPVEPSGLTSSVVVGEYLSPSSSTPWVRVQHSHWSSDASRWGTLTPEVYDFRGSFDVCMVGVEEIPAEQGSSQSCD